MIPTGKSIDILCKTSFRVPSEWKTKMGVIQGEIAKIYIKSDCIIIKSCHETTIEITSTIGSKGSIYIPIEVRNHFHLKGVNIFEIFIDEENDQLLLNPKNKISG